MRRLLPYSFALLLAFSAGAGQLFADSILPAGDTLQISLDPLSGSIDGLPGATVGWGFDITWASSNGDWVSFNSTNLASETNFSILDSLAPDGGYVDFIEILGGPDDSGIGPTDGPWSQSFDPNLSLGVGSYQIAADAVPGAEDTGLIVFHFDIYNEDPLVAEENGVAPVAPDQTLSEAFSVTVDSETPEPGTWLLTAGALMTIFVVPFVRRRFAGI